MSALIKQDVLIVDDDEAIRNLLVLAMRRVGMTCGVAGDGLEALARMREAEYAIVLLDVMMPRLDGFGFVTSLREWQKHDGVRPIVVFMTAAPDHEKLTGTGDIVQALIAKPFDIYEVAEMARACVTERRIYDASVAPKEHRAPLH